MENELVEYTVEFFWGAKNEANVHHLIIQGGDNVSGNIGIHLVS